MRIRGSILVVEDDRMARESLRRLLQPHYDVEVASNGAGALEILRNTEIDTVTLEPWLQGIQGRELLSRIRAATPGARIVIVTGHPLSMWFDDGVRDEVFDYLPKPFEPRELLRVVRKSLVRIEMVERPLALRPVM